MRLSEANLSALSPHVALPGYDRAAQRVGIVHFGIGAFHRAHQAAYTDDAMAAGERDWAITGVSLRSGSIRDQMMPQDGLYTIVERSSAGSALRLIGAVTAVLVAPETPQAVIDALGSADTHIVSFTITEKGYWRRADGGLDIAAADVAHDLSGAGAPRTIYGFLAKAFVQRRANGLPGLTLLTCDNLAENGEILAGLLGDFLDRADPESASWFRMHCTCPSTMVDRIVPATTPGDRDTLTAEIGLRDEALVLTEAFRQWVIEDKFAGPRPLWENVGAQIVADVRPYEIAKLRMLNGAHSAIAYLGLRAGHDYVHQAVADSTIRPLIETLMRQEAAATLDPLADMDTNAYADALFARFSNSALPHRLIQIAMDGSQKIPQRWLQPLVINRNCGRDCSATFTALAAWLLHIRGDARPVDDPMAGELAGLWARHGLEGIVAALFGTDGVFAASWTASPQDQQALTAHLMMLAV
ncbi:mannitol dehydrogenase family protein [Sphingobium boeckii]|uniref:Fructuronate reductase n=1 Tax=Sphingobium boeckii TaxID=1082345 RepID=A0A7W9EDJ4_9SPHN|nr:mannitol dehydrogenase family protein [Sphingobium boeckii]MBB5685353.1 fructuronate reductase [Sphingobium boeckii]